MGEIRTKLIKGATALSVARLVVNSLSLISTILLARMLLPDDFGVVALATTILFILTSVTDLSLSNALIHQKEVHEDHLHSAWTLDFIRWQLLALIVGLSSYPVAFIFSEPRLFGIMIALSFSTALCGFNNPRLALFMRELDFRQNIALSITSKLVGFIVSITIAFLFRSYWAIVGGYVSAQLSSIALSYWIAPYKPKFMLKRIKELWAFSIWLSLGQIVNTLNWRFDQLLIGGFLGREELGHYTVGDTLAYTPTREATAPLGPVLFPAFSSFRDEPLRLRDAYIRAQTVTTAIALPAGVGTALIADPLVRLTMGENWLPTVFIIQALASIFALQTLSAAVQPLAMGLGETKRLFFRDCFSFAMRIPIIITGLVLGGLFGLVIARCVSGTIAILINMYLVRQMISIGIIQQLVSNGRALMATLAMVAVVLALSGQFHYDNSTSSLIFEIAAYVTLGGFTYVATSSIMWLLAGKPLGPESFVVDIARAGVSRFR